MYNHHPPTQGAAGWAERAASLPSSQQDPYPSSSCIRHWCLGVPYPTARHHIPFSSTLPGAGPWEMACRRRDGVCVQERACVHVREKEAGL